MLKFIEWVGIKLYSRRVVGNCSSRLKWQNLGLNVVGVVQLPQGLLKPSDEGSS